ncbi:MAG TPA: hypothetical protein VMZ50_04925 [Phycisphaerae bacterium]|nr:hypothetical protein [Phycisphaerae bacterium]
MGSGANEDRILLVGGGHHGEWVRDMGRMCVFPKITGLELGWAAGEDDLGTEVRHPLPERVGPMVYYEMRTVGGERVYVMIGDRDVA